MQLKPDLKKDQAPDQVQDRAENPAEVSEANPQVLAPKNLDPSQSAMVLARRLVAFELKDDHHMDCSFLKDPTTKAELDLVSQMLESKFIGIIARCKIQGCDIHALNNELEIIKHFQETESISEEFIKARELAQTIDETIIAILVFQTHNVLLHVNGRLEVVT